MGARRARDPSRNRIRSWLKPRRNRNLFARAGVSFTGSTEIAKAGTSWPRSSSAPRICVAVSGHVSRHVVYMNVRTTTRPRNWRSETVLPSWSRRRKSCGGVSGRSAPAEATESVRVARRAKSATPSAPASTRVAVTNSAMRRRAGIAPQGRRSGRAGAPVAARTMSPSHGRPATSDLRLDEAPPGRGAHEPAPDRVAHELDAVAHPQLAHATRALGLPGLQDGARGARAFDLEPLEHPAVRLPQ